MLRSFFTIAIRNFSRQFTYSVINVTGLAIGIACSLVIFVYVFQELSYEKHFKEADKIYRVATKFMTMGEFANGPQILLETLPKEYPWVDKTCRVKAENKVSLQVEKEIIIESGLFVEENFFEIFNYPFAEGGGNLLGNGIVLNKKVADKLFKKGNAVGKLIVLTIDEKEELFRVEGVVNTSKIKSHLNAPFWATMSPNTQWDPNWMMVDTYNYIKVKPNTDRATIQSGLDKMIETHLFPLIGSTLPFEEWFVRDDAFRLIAQPLEDVYLKGTLRFDLTSGGNATMVYLLMVIAFLILVIAAVNFINLSTARSIKRSKEVGLKKVIGSSRTQLALQFLAESVLISLTAMVLSLGLAELILLSVQQITGLQILDSIFSNPGHLLLAFGLAFILGILSGIYPAIVLSSFKPVDVLKSSFKGKSTAWFRNTLVVFQFGLSTILVIGTLVIFRQLQFMSKKDVGFKQDNLLIIENAAVLSKSLSVFKEDITNRPGVLNASVVNRVPASATSFSIGNLKSIYNDESLRVNRFQGDFDYPSTLGFELVAGRFFDRKLASDSNAVLLNEAAVNALFLEHPIGEVLNQRFTVIGVVRDFNFESLKKVIAPSMISISNEGQQMAIRMESGKARDIIEYIEKKWTSFSPEEAINYHFLDQNFADMMRNEKMIGEVLALFTLLAVFVACLGLFGLSAYLSTQRSKEIGIRKVLGASVANVLGMFGKAYAKLILISFVIAVPLAVYIMQKWLTEFAYKVEIEWWVIALTCLSVLVIAWGTVCFHSIKASIINPAETLRSE